VRKINDAYAARMDCVRESHQWMFHFLITLSLWFPSVDFLPGLKRGFAAVWLQRTGAPGRWQDDTRAAAN